MPVPVPVYSKPAAHTVIKNTRNPDPVYSRHSVFQHLTNSLPQPPQGPPPAFATREEWINSLPSWRRNKPRRIWEEDSYPIGDNLQGFQPGLAVAGDATAIKGARAQASIPPVSSQAAIEAAAIPTSADMYYSTEEEADDEMSPVDGITGWQGENMFRFADEDDDMRAEQGSDSGSMECSSDYQGIPYSVDVDSEGRQTFPHSYERGAFSPIFEDTSDNEPSSSPAGPATPFADFVDRAVSNPRITFEHARDVVETTDHMQYCYGEGYCGNQCHQCQRCIAEPAVQQPVAAPEPVATPTASAAYRKLAEPLAEWMVSFVWKVCTTGMSLPPQYAQPAAFLKHYSSQPPSQVARSTQSMLLSTLLQPSAVFLALWYIVRLPVFFGPVGLGSEHVREMRFRAELLGDAHLPLDRDALESFAPFRLILLGCMLANKWLDDHTFSNKTWHTISNVPIQSLNRLESLALDLFAHDLSVPLDEWSRWLTQLHVYHMSLSSPAFPQPISRPSTSPHNIVRKSIEDLLEVSHQSESHEVNNVPEPIFYGIENNEKGSADTSQAQENVDVLEIDLDEDGPLREEYLPKRRISGAGNSKMVKQEYPVDISRSLPPPAKWSPAADEPLTRGNARPHAQYLAPHPTVHGSSGMLAPPPPPAPAPFHQALDMSRRIWPMDEQVARHAYMPVHAPVYAPHPPFGSYEYTYPPPPVAGHSRSQSLSYNPLVIGQIPGHYRSYSQVQPEPSGMEANFAPTHFAAARTVAPIQWTAFPNRAVYSSVYDPSYDYPRPLIKV